MAGLFDTPITPPLRVVLEEVRNGVILLPEFQRPFIWNEEQRLDLMDSIAKGMPIGTLLVWRTLKHDLGTLPNLGPHRLREKPKDGPRTYLIDGHQRLTTLYAALTPGEESSLVSETGERWPIYMDLQGNEDDRLFVLAKRRQRPRATLIPSWVLLSNRMVYQHQKELWEQGLQVEADRLENIANAFKDYPLPIIPMVSEDLSMVTRAFARINSSGTAMDESAIAAALAYGRLPLRAELGRLAERFDSLGWPIIDPGALLNLFKLKLDLDVYRADIETLVDRLSGKNPIERLDVVIADCEEALQSAIRALSGVPMAGSAVIPYRYQILLLAEALRRRGAMGLLGLTPEIKNRAQRWFWQTSFCESFTGATGKTIRDALDELVDVLGGKPSALEDTEVRFVNKQQKRWGSVRVSTRLLALAVAVQPDDGGYAVKALTTYGGSAVHKIDPNASEDRPGSWIIGDVEDLAKLRRGEDVPACHQIHPEARSALVRGELEEFLAIQDPHVLEIERKTIEAHGLRRDAAPTSSG